MIISQWWTVFVEWFVIVYWLLIIVLLAGAIFAGLVSAILLMTKDILRR